MIELIRHAAQLTGVAPTLLLAICSVESSLVNQDNMDDGGSPSYGICQIKLTTARDYMPGVTPEMLREPQVNALIAGQHISWLLERYDGHPCRAISAYNVGHVRFNEGGNYVNYGYVRKVQERARHFGRGITCDFPKPVSNKEHSQRPASG